MNYEIPNVDITQHFSPLQMFQYYDKYSKFLWDKTRREDWHETVARTVDFLRELSNDKLSFDDYQEMYNLIYLGEITPSMRMLNVAGDYARRNNESIYNCSYHVLDSLDAFAEFQWLSMCGCGIATSVEKHNIDKLPKVHELTGNYINYKIDDSSEGWKDATDYLVKQLWLNGDDVRFDYSDIRPTGAPLITKGGYSSGPQVLEDVHKFIRGVLRGASGRKVTTVEGYDIATKIPECGISGGSRRAAMLVLFDADDESMNKVKYDGFWSNPEHAHRVNANNSAVWPEHVTQEDVKELTHQLFSTGTGENGIYKRDNAIRTSPSWRQYRNPETAGVNACFHRDTKVLTKKGIFRIEELVGKEVEIWNGDYWQVIDNFRMTNKNQELFKVTLHDGSDVITTDYHTFILDNCDRVELNQLQVGDKLKISKLASFNKIDNWNKVISIEYYGIDDVFCCTVEGNHQLALANGIDIGQCGEISLESQQFCNLSAVICKPEDTLKSLIHKTKYATLIGDIQSLATEFNLRPLWKYNCDTDRLLGVNHIGHANSPEIRKPPTQRYLRDYTVEIDLEFSKLFGVNRSAAITAVKPSGNSSVLLGVGPGINPIHNQYSRRNVTVNKSTAMYRFLSDYKIPVNDYPSKDTHVMFGFPYKAPENSIILDDTTALEQLEYWKVVKKNLVHHNPSCSIVYHKDEEEEIQKWLFENQDIIGGLTFFPKFDNSYGLLPIQKLNKEEYEELEKLIPNIQWDILHSYETMDESKTIAECSGGRCDI